jgi:hypothetical protein
MRLMSQRSVIGLLILALTCVPSGKRSSTMPHSARLLAGSQSPSEPTDKVISRGTHMDESYGRLPLSFERNVGQTDPRVDFVSRGRGYVVYLSGGDAVLALAAGGGPDDEGGESASVVRMQLAGANRTAKAIGRDELPGKANYFIANDPKRWRTNVPTYEKVSYADVYPDIDLVYYGKRQTLEYDFVVRPGAGPARIVLTFQGADKLEVDARGDLVIHTGSGILRQSRPVIYQEREGQRREIAGAYVLLDALNVGFKMGAYDTSLPLVIDPTLVYSTYLGGVEGGDDLFQHGIAADAEGCAYVAGWTASLDFPTTPGAFDTSFNGAYDAFVSKLAPNGASLLYSSYFGGNGADRILAIAVDAAGRAYVTGVTSSVDFPTTAGAFNTSLGAAPQAAFAAKIGEAGSALLYSTYFGGTNGDIGHAIAVDAAGNAYLTGQTSSSDFPTTAGAFDTSLNNSVDAFLSKLNATGSALVYSTFLGGSLIGNNGTDQGYAIAVDSAGNAYVAGSTDALDFPTTQGAFDTSYNGGTNAFVTKLNATGSALIYSTYLGGSSDAHGIAVDAAGTAYVAGSTTIPDFPTTPGAFDTSYNGGRNAFVTRFDAAGALLYSTYLGSSDSAVRAIAIDADGNAYVTGKTYALDFPTTPDAFGPSYHGSVRPRYPEGFIVKFDPSGSALVYSTYLGGGGEDQGLGIAVGQNGASVYVTGDTGSADFPVTPGAFDTSTFGGAFAVRLSFATDTTPPVATVSSRPSLLWPPTGKLVAVVIAGTMTDDVSGIASSTAAFRVVDEYGVIQPAGAIAVIPNGSYSLRVMLEASRRGVDRNGRRYEVWVSVADKAGNRSSVSAIVTVPHDRP